MGMNLNGAKLESWSHYPVAADAVIDVGDLMFWDASAAVAKPVKLFTYSSSDARTRKRMKRDFLGISNAAHRAGDSKRTIMILTDAEVDVDIACPTTVEPGDLFGISIGDLTALTPDNQEVVKVADPSEAIGASQRVYTDEVSRARLWIKSNRGGFDSPAFGRSLDQVQFVLPLTTAQTILSAVAVEKVLGGPAELLAIGLIETTALTVQDLIITLSKNGTPLTQTFTAPLSGAAVGRTTEQDLSADTAREFNAGDTLTLAVTQNPTAGAGVLYLRFRRKG